MPYYVGLPNGSYVEVPDDVTPAAARKRIVEAFPELANIGPPERGIGQLFSQGVGRFTEGTKTVLGDYLPAMLGRGVEAAGEATGIQSVEEAGRSFAERQLREAQRSQLEAAKNPREFESYEQVTGPVSAARYAAETLGETLPSVGLSIAGGLVGAGLGALVGGPVGAAVGGAKGAAVGRTVGAAAGLYGSNVVQTVPQSYASILRETGKEEIGAALIAGGINAALESVMPASALSKMSGPARDALVGSVKRRLGLGFAESAALEGLTEGMQEAVDKAAISFVDENKEFFTSENWKQILDSSIRGAITGGVVGGATNVAFGRRGAATPGSGKPIDEILPPEGQQPTPPAEPTPTEPTPTEPTPTEPTPTEPTPTEPTPTEPTPVAPTPTEPTPTEPTPTEPTPVAPTPTEPTPTEPTPTEPTPVAPTPTEPTPVAPTPTEPTPTEPTPVEPAPVPQTGGLPAFALPKPLAGAKPKYGYGPNQFTPAFDNDVDKALYITSQSSPSAKDADYRAFLRDVGFTDQEISDLGPRIRDHLKKKAQGAIKSGQTGGSLPVDFLRTTYPSVYKNILDRPSPNRPQPISVALPTAPKGKPAPLSPPANLPPPTPLTPAPAGLVQEPVKITLSPKTESEFEAQIPGVTNVLRTLVQGMFPGTSWAVKSTTLPNAYGRAGVYFGTPPEGKSQFILEMDIKKIKAMAGSPEAEKSYFLKTLFHELSHPLEYTWIRTADQATYSAILDQYVKQRNPSSVERFFLLQATRTPEILSDPDALSLLLNVAGLDQSQYEAFKKDTSIYIPSSVAPNLKATDVGSKYMRSFAEWIAEQGARWYASELQNLVPKTTFQKFQKAVLDRLRSLYTQISQMLGIKPTEGAFEKLLRDVYGRRARTPTPYEVPAAPAIIKSKSAASVGPSVSSSAAQYQTGKPVEVNAYHGSPYAFDQFDPNRRGQTTRAMSGRSAFFFSEKPETANVYAKQAGSPVMLEIGVDELARSQFGMAQPRSANDGYSDLDVRQANERIAATREAMTRQEAEQFNDMMRSYAGNTNAFMRTEFPSRADATEARNKLKAEAAAIEEFLTSADPGASRPNVRLSRIRMKNPLVLDQGGKTYRESAFLDAILDAKKKGHDGVIFTNTYDGGPLDNIFAVFRPEQIGDRFTRWAESADLAPTQVSSAAQEPAPAPAAGKQTQLVKSWKDVTELTSRGDQSMTGMVGGIMRNLLGVNPGESYGRAFTRNVVNSNIPFLERADLRNLGKLIEGMMNASGRVMGLVTIAPMGYSQANKNFFFHTGKDADPLYEIFKDIGTRNADQGQKVFLAMREQALRRDKIANQGGLSPLPPGITRLSDQELQNIIDSADPVVIKAAERFQRFNDKIIEMSVQTGLIPRELGEKFKTMMYIPMYRLQKMDSEGNPDSVFSQGVYDAMRSPAGLAAFNKRVGELAVGGPVYGNLYENILSNYNAIVSSAVRNVAYQETAKTLTKMMRDGGDTTIGEVFDSKPAKMDSVQFRMDGQTKYLVIHDQAMFQAIAALSPQQRNAYIRAAAKFTDLLRKGVTAAPPFQLRNLIRGLVAVKVQTGQPVFSMLKGTLDGARDTWNKGDAYREIVGRTGFGGFGFGSGASDMAAYMDRMYKERELSWGEWQKYPNAFMRFFDKLERIGEVTEMAPRIGYYNYLIRQGVSKEDATWEAVNLVNYHRHGTGNGLVGGAVSTLIPLVPFLTARIQGLYRLVEPGTAGAPKSLVGNGYVGIPAAIVSRGLMVLAINAAVNMMYGDEDWYKKLSVKDRLSNMYVKVGDVVLALPRAYEIGELFGGLPTLLMDSIRKESGSDIASGVGQFITKTFMIEPIPQIFKPPIEILANKNFYTGLPIENLSDKRSPKEERFDEYTSSFAKMAGHLTKYVELSPKQVDSLIRGYLGTMSTLFLGTADSLMGSAGTKPQGAFGDPNSFAGVVGNLTGVTSILKTESQLNNKFVGDFYEIKDKITQIVTSMNNAATRQDLDTIKARLEQMPQARGLYTAFNSVNARLTEINKQMGAIRVSPSLTPERKTELLEQLRTIKGQIAQQAVQAAERAGVTR